MGSVNAYYSVQAISNSVNCSEIAHGGYIVWSGPPACGNWEDVFNVTVPSSIPSYITKPESVNEAWIISNVYHAD